MPVWKERENTPEKLQAWIVHYSGSIEQDIGAFPCTDPFLYKKQKNSHRNLIYKTSTQENTGDRKAYVVIVDLFNVRAVYSP